MTRIPSLRKTIVLVAAALAATGCGGGERTAETTTRPTLPRSVAEDLAARSDAIADALDAGEVCMAAGRADELLDATIAAINDGRVPQEFQEDLQARANELVNTVNCPPPTTTTTTVEEKKKKNKGSDKGRGKKKGHEQGEDSNQGEDEPVPVPTESVPTVTEVIP